MERETCLQRGLSESASVNVLIWEFVDFNLGFGLSCLPEIIRHLKILVKNCEFEGFFG